MMEAVQCSKDAQMKQLLHKHMAKHGRVTFSGQDSAANQHLEKGHPFEMTMYSFWPGKRASLREE